ncbi:MAG: beta-galactosidase, partial [Glycomyces artemisiae]|nr:beta-galactosidase [Glycomyces artemisiae]
VLTDAASKTLRGYVENGGHLVVSYFSGIVDEHDTVHPGAHPGALRETLGLWIEEFHPLHEGESLDLDSGAAGRIWSEHVRLDGAEAVARFASGPDAGRPALSRHDLGRGTAWYAATALDAGTGLDELLATAMDAAGVERPQGVPDGVEMVRRGVHRFLINHTGQDVQVPGAGVDALDGTAYDGRVPVRAGGVVVLADA